MSEVSMLPAMGRYLVVESRAVETGQGDVKPGQRQG
jgi:hypothetical protein